jgi:hypothetical protein
MVHGPYHKRALEDFNRLGIYKGMQRVLGIINELEDILEIYQRSNNRLRKKLKLEDPMVIAQKELDNARRIRGG